MVRPLGREHKEFNYVMVSCNALVVRGQAHSREQAMIQMGEWISEQDARKRENSKALTFDVFFLARSDGVSLEEVSYTDVVAALRKYRKTTT